MTEEYYTLVMASSIEELGERVNAIIVSNVGWKPFGSPVWGRSEIGGRWAQAMIRVYKGNGLGRSKKKAKEKK